MPTEKKTDDGNTAQWDKLKSMRTQSGTELKPEGDQPRASNGQFTSIELTRERAADPAAIQREHDQMTGKIETPVVEVVAGDPDDDTPEPAKVEAKPGVVATPPPAGTEEVEIDGNKVFVDASLAAAMREDAKLQKDNVKDAEHQKLVDQIREELKAELPPAKTAAELAAEKALADAELPDAPVARPDGKLAIEDPDKFALQMADYADDQAKRAAKKAVAEATQKTVDQQRIDAAANAKQQEEWARQQLGIQFFNKYPVLAKPEMRVVVDTILNSRLTDVMKSGILSKIKTPADGEALKNREFAAVAAEATRKIVALQGAGKAVAPAPEAPPALVASAPAKSPSPKAKEPAEKPRERYPSGSVSSILDKHKRGKIAAA